MSESVDVKNCIYEVKKILARDIKNRNIEIQVRTEDEVPNSIQSDQNKIIQVILHIFLQSINKQLGGFINIKLSKRDIDNIAYIMIDIENTKFEVKRYDLKELKRLTRLGDFAKIM